MNTKRFVLAYTFLVIALAIICYGLWYRSQKHLYESQMAQIAEITDLGQVRLESGMCPWHTVNKRDYPRLLSIIKQGVKNSQLLEYQGNVYDSLLIIRDTAEREFIILIYVEIIQERRILKAWYNYGIVSFQSTELDNLVNEWILSFSRPSVREEGVK